MEIILIFNAQISNPLELNYYYLKNKNYSIFFEHRKRKSTILLILNFQPSRVDLISLYINIITFMILLKIQMEIIRL